MRQRARVARVVTFMARHLVSPAIKLNSKCESEPCHTDPLYEAADERVLEVAALERLIGRVEVNSEKQWDGEATCREADEASERGPGQRPERLPRNERGTLAFEEVDDERREE